MNSHGSDDLIRHARDRRDRDNGGGVGVDRVAVVSPEQALLLTEHLVAQRPRADSLPRQVSKLDPELRG
jgi:hypothetical protein